MIGGGGVKSVRRNRCVDIINSSRGSRYKFGGIDIRPYYYRTPDINTHYVVYNNEIFLRKCGDGSKLVSSQFLIREYTITCRPCCRSEVLIFVAFGILGIGVCTRDKGSSCSRTGCSTTRDGGGGAFGCVPSNLVYL